MHKFHTSAMFDIYKKMRYNSIKPKKNGLYRDKFVTKKKMENGKINWQCAID